LLKEGIGSPQDAAVVAGLQTTREDAPPTRAPRAASAGAAIRHAPQAVSPPAHKTGVIRRFLQKNILTQASEAGRIRISQYGNFGWRSRRASTARIARLLSVTSFW